MPNKFKGKKEKAVKVYDFLKVKKIAEFNYAYLENAQRVAMAHAQSCHLVKVEQKNSQYKVEIFQIEHYLEE